MLRNSFIQCAICRKQLLYICPPVPETKTIGIPVVDHQRTEHTQYGPRIPDELALEHAHYVNAVSEFAHGFAPVHGFDTVLVDGRFRVACAMRAASEHSHENTSILVHDFQRKVYSPLAEARFGFKLVEQRHRLAQLSPPQNASVLLKGAHRHFLGYWW